MMKNTKGPFAVRLAMGLFSLAFVLMMTASCKSKPVAEDPHAKIDKAHREHMDQNKEEYKKEPR